MCDILAAISYSYGYHERPTKRVKINMTIPSRPAPPPPQRNATAPLRYTPTTDWDFCAFDAAPTTTVGSSGQTSTGNRHGVQLSQQQQQHQQNVKAKKPPPPRPPPPKLPSAPVAPLKKPGQPQSINILSSLFGHKRIANGMAASKPNASGVPLQKSSSGSVPAKLLPPPPSASAKVFGKTASSSAGGMHQSTGSTNYGSLMSTVGSAPATTAAASLDMQLISFDSPPSSPTFTQKSCSDCISVDSFSSDSNYSSPNNGNMSQAESGFEDDFVATANSQRPSPSAPWGELAVDPFDSGPVAGTGRTANSNIYARVPTASSSATAQIRAPLVNSKLQHSDFVDPLCNGQSVFSKVATMSMPTIIKPPASSSGSDSQKSTPVHSVRNATGPGAMPPYAYAGGTKGPEEATGGRSGYAVGIEASPETATFDSFTSHPMPSVPPPPPPAIETYSDEPYGIALYDFQGEAMEDLSFKTNEKIYLLKRLNSEWYMGRDKRGLEGIFPVNYVEVKVPLCFSSEDQRQENTSPLPTTVPVKVRALYNFNAETSEDLTIEEHDLVTVLYQITPEWLFGEIDGRRGQFPANYIDFVPPNLPQMPSTSS